MDKNLKPFEVSSCLTSNKIIAEFLADILQDNDPQLFCAALEEVAKAKGLNTELKQETSKDNAQFGIIQKLLNSLGLKLTVQPI